MAATALVLIEAMTTPMRSSRNPLRSPTAARPSSPPKLSLPTPTTAPRRLRQIHLRSAGTRRTTTVTMARHRKPVRKSFRARCSRHTTTILLLPACTCRSSLRHQRSRRTHQPTACKGARTVILRTPTTTTRRRIHRRQAAPLRILPDPFLAVAHPRATQATERRMLMVGIPIIPITFRNTVATRTTLLLRRMAITCTIRRPTEHHRDRIHRTAAQEVEIPCSINACRRCKIPCSKRRRKSSPNSESRSSRRPSRSKKRRSRMPSCNPKSSRRSRSPNSKCNLRHCKLRRMLRKSTRHCNSSLRRRSKMPRSIDCSTSSRNGSFNRSTNGRNVPSRKSKSSRKKSSSCNSRLPMRKMLLATTKTVTTTTLATTATTVIRKTENRILEAAPKPTWPRRTRTKAAAAMMTTVTTITTTTTMTKPFSMPSRKSQHSNSIWTVERCRTRRKRRRTYRLLTTTTTKWTPQRHPTILTQVEKTCQPPPRRRIMQRRAPIPVRSHVKIHQRCWQMLRNPNCTTRTTTISRRRTARKVPAKTKCPPRCRSNKMRHQWSHSVRISRWEPLTPSTTQRWIATGRPRRRRKTRTTKMETKKCQPLSPTNSRPKFENRMTQMRTWIRNLRRQLPAGPRLLAMRMVPME
mmetsp:Transcript_4146/g.11840  ORF Transcript_4146/g.11840 Transcript_4146/m.11840 type:complete len:636 (-) Transcript_4146:710-2617(-)